LLQVAGGEAIPVVNRSGGSIRAGPSSNQIDAADNEGEREFFRRRVSPRTPQRCTTTTSPRSKSLGWDRWTHFQNSRRGLTTSSTLSYHYIGFSKRGWDGGGRAERTAGDPRAENSAECSRHEKAIDVSRLDEYVPIPFRDSEGLSANIWQIRMHVHARVQSEDGRVRKRERWRE